MIIPKQTQTVAALRTLPPVRSDDMNCFTYRPDRPWRWVQRVCLWILKKIKAHRVIKHDAEVVEIRREDFLTALEQQKNEVFKLLNKESRVMLIGAEDHAQMMNTPAIRRLLMFTIPYEVHSYGVEWPPVHTRKICGLNVVIIPWMRGILLLPRAQEIRLAFEDYAP